MINNMLKMSTTYFINPIRAWREMKTFKKIMTIITKTKMADLKIIMSLTDQKIMMISKQTSFMKATINLNQRSIIIMKMKWNSRTETKSLKIKNIIRTRVTARIINIILKVSRSKEGTRADMYPLLRIQKKRNSRKG